MTQSELCKEIDMLAEKIANYTKGKKFIVTLNVDGTVPIKQFASGNYAIIGKFV